MKMTLGQKLHELRLGAEMTQHTAAKKAKVNATALSHWEADRRTPVLATLVRLAKLYKVTLDQMVENTKL